MENLSGTISEVLFDGNGTSSAIYIVVDDGGEYCAIVCDLKGEKDDLIEAEGEFYEHPELGRTMSPSSCSITPSVSAERIIAVLCSSGIQGIGKGTVTKIVDHFGAKDAVRVIETDIEALAAIKGVGPKRAQIIVEGWKKAKAADIGVGILALQRMGLPRWMAKRVAKHYLGKATEIVRRHPYRICREVPGIGFKSADEIALAMGVQPNSEVRIDAGLKYVLDAATSTGDCGIPKVRLLDKAAAELRCEVSICRDVLEKKLANPSDPDMVLHGRAVFSRKLAKAEEDIATELKRLSDGKPAWLTNETPEELHALISKSEEALGVKLASQQRQAAFLALTRCVSILTGGPGTGKTKSLQVVIHVLQNWPGRKDTPIGIAVAAPTGKAANRASEVIGMPASTVHRMLGLRGGDDEESELILSSDRCVVDEFSMMDVPLTAAMLKAIGGQTSLMIVGDVDQLESVGPGKVLRDMIDSGVIPVTRLTEIFRQASGSLIIRNAHRVNRGEWLEPAKATDDCFFLQEEGCEDDSPEEVATRIADTVCDLVCRRLPERYGYNPMTDIQVLSPMNKGACGVFELNRRLQSMLNPSPRASMKKGDVHIAEADKIIQTRNNYDLNIFNGDVGYIRHVELQQEKFYAMFGSMVSGLPEAVRSQLGGTPSHERVMSTAFEHFVEMSLEDLDDIRLAYAMTIHKSQGSEAPVVVIPLSMQHYVMMQRNLIYTGMTRARKLLVMVGQRRALEAAISNTRSTRRVTRLKELLQREFAA